MGRPTVLRLMTIDEITTDAVANLLPSNDGMEHHLLTSLPVTNRRHSRAIRESQSCRGELEKLRDAPDTNTAEQLLLQQNQPVAILRPLSSLSRKLTQISTKNCGPDRRIPAGDHPVSLSDSDSPLSRSTFPNC